MLVFLEAILHSTDTVIAVARPETTEQTIAFRALLVRR